MTRDTYHCDWCGHDFVEEVPDELGINQDVACPKCRTVETTRTYTVPNEGNTRDE